MTLEADEGARTRIAMWYEGEVRAITRLIKQRKDDKDRYDIRQRWACSGIDINAETYRQNALNDSKCEGEVLLPRHTMSSINYIAQIST